MSKKISISTDLFKGKPVPDFIKNHSMFKNPVKLKKVFPSIGLPNFKDVAQLDKCLVDVKKEGSYVHNLLKVMLDFATQGRDHVAHQADKIQFLDSKSDRQRTKEILNELYTLAKVLTEIATYIDPHNKENLSNIIHTTDGRVALKLPKTITNENDGKPIFREGASLFSVFGRLREKCAALNVPFNNLEQHESFKIFSKENIPNKEFSIIFSSEGGDGAWDIITMSMRGIKSCQRWDGDYPKCLIGSVLSKFVGVIYLTSGVQSDGYTGADGVPYNNLGTKMMRRCVVRYAIDADEDKPCILIDKMYPDLDKDVLSLFMNSIKSKTKFPVYYAQELGNKLRHIYLPSEKIREEVSDREWSYQDTPLKSKHDLNIYLLFNNKEEVEREVKGFRMNLALFMARKMEDIYNGNMHAANPEVKKIISNLRMNTSFTPFCEAATSYMMNSFRAPLSKDFTNSRLYYRKYVMEFLIKRKNLLASSQQNLLTLLQQNSSRQTTDGNDFVNYLGSVAVEFCKSEITKLVN